MSGFAGTISSLRDAEPPLGLLNSDPRGQAVQQLRIRGSSQLLWFLSNAKQKIMENQDWAMVLSGQIYGLSIEQLFQLWCQQGAEILSTIHGSFTMACWDKHTQRLWLIRDAMGIKPLYWSKNQDQLAFASEPSALLSLPWVSSELAFSQLAEYLSFRYVHSPNTLYKDISALPAGHMLVIDKNNAQLERWFRPNWWVPGSEIPDPAFAVDRIDTLIHRAVERCLADRPKAGVLLSGGLDSSAILHHANGIMGPLPSFTVALSGASTDESPFAARVSKLLGSPNKILRVHSDQLIERLEELSAIMPHPLPTAAAAIQSLLFEYAKQEVDVLLSGDGGDECLGGRSMPQLVKRIEQARLISSLPGMGRSGLRAIGKRLGIRDITAPYDRFGEVRVVGGSRVFIAPERVNLLTDPGLVRPNIRQTLLNPLYKEVDSDPINDILHVWQRGWLVEDSLMRNDRISQHHDIRVRLPMLDRELNEYCRSLSGWTKIRSDRFNTVAKWPLQQAMEKRLPRRILRRPKRTWLSPLDVWLQQEGRHFLNQEVDEICRNYRHIFVPQYVQQLRAEHRSGTHNHGLKLWTLLLFHLWWKHHQ